MRIEEIISQQVFADLDARLATFEQQLVLLSVEHSQLADLVRSEVTALSQSHVVLSERVEAVHAKLDEILAAIGNVPPVTPEDPWQPVSAQVNAFTNPDWDRGVYRTKAGVSIKANEAFAIGAHVKLADGQVRLVNMVTHSGENQSVFFEGPLLDPALVGAPNVITTTTDPIYITEPVGGYVGPLVGANFAGLGNNPWFNPTTQPAQLGTHYRTSMKTAQNPDFFAVYGAHLIDDEEFLVRMPYALERLFVIQNGQPVLQEGYANEMIAFMDAAYAQGGRTIMDMHNYCRVWQPEQFNADGSLKYPGLQRKQQTVNNKTVRAQWFPINHPGCKWNYALLAQAYRLIAQRFGSHPGLLAYGLMNEPHGRGGQDEGIPVEQLWTQHSFDLYHAIRELDQEHWITFGGNAYSTAKNCRAVNQGFKGKFKGLHKVMFELHQYPDENGGGGGQWKAGITHSVDPVARVNDWVDSLDWCDEEEVVAFAGEFGCPADIPGGTEFLEQLHELFDERGVLRTQWLSGPGKSDTYANGMDTAAGELKPNAAATINRIGLMKD